MVTQVDLVLVALVLVVLVVLATLLQSVPLKVTLEVVGLVLLILVVAKEAVVPLQRVLALEVVQQVAHPVEMEQQTQSQVLLLQDQVAVEVVVGPLALIQQQAQVDLVAVELALLRVLQQWLEQPTLVAVAVAQEVAVLLQLQVVQES
jgi:hypothetical protein